LDTKYKEILNVLTNKSYCAALILIMVIVIHYWLIGVCESRSFWRIIG